MIKKCDEITTCARQPYDNDKSTCAFSIALDGTKNREESYLDVRLCIHVRPRIENCHILAIPINKSHTGLAMFDHVHEVLQSSVGDLWSTRHIPVAIDGAGNMTGRL